jgi:hypothetical protein
MAIVKVVVTPGDGALRRPIVARLLAGGHDARPLVGPLPPGPELRELLGGAGAVVHAAGGLHGTSDLDLADTRRVAKAAAATGTHLVLVVPGPVAAIEAVVESVGDGWTLQPTTTLHPEVSAWLERLRLGPVVAVPKALSLQPVDPDEVAARLGVLLRAGPAGRVPVFGGPDVRPVADLARAWLRASGRRGLVVATPRVGEPAGAVTFPDRAVARVTFGDWLEADPVPSAPDGEDRRQEAVGAE